MFSTGTRSSTNLNKATDGELFALMAERGSASEEAWAEFYERYVKDFHRLVCRVKGIPQARVEGLVQDTMIQAFGAAHTFREGDVSSAEGKRLQTLAWLCRIANRLHWSALRRQEGTFVGSLSQQEGEDGSQLSTKGRRLSRGELHREIKDVEDVTSGVVDDEYVSPLRRRLREAMDLLSERERDILAATYAYYKRGQEKQRLPNAVAKEIREKYGLSPANFRKLRERALSKIERYVTRAQGRQFEDHEEEKRR